MAAPAPRLRKQKINPVRGSAPVTIKKEGVPPNQQPPDAGISRRALTADDLSTGKKLRRTKGSR
jgi:hypothetical protein